MKTFGSFKTLALSAFALLFMACSSETSREIIVCGTYTVDTGSYGIYSLTFDDGRLQVVDSVQVGNPSFLILSEDKHKVYAVSEFFDSAAVNTIDFDPRTATFGREVRKAGGCADNPCNLVKINDYLITADYSGGALSFFPVDDKGIARNASRSDSYIGCGPDTVRQKSAHIHCAVPSKDGNALFVTDLGSDRIYHYAIENGIVSEFAIDTITLPDGCGPRLLEFSPDGKRCYLLCELSGEVMAFDYAENTLRHFQTVVCDTLQERASGDIHISHDGRFLYASNRRRGDGIRIFEIDETGHLSNRGFQPTGLHPRNFAITPDDKYVLVACRDSNGIEVYLRDMVTGMLTKTGNTLYLPAPVCLKFTR